MSLLTGPECHTSVELRKHCRLSSQAFGTCIVSQ